MRIFQKGQRKFWDRSVAIVVIVTFCYNLVVPPAPVHAQTVPVQSFMTLQGLPVPGSLVSPSPQFTPPLLKGITIDPENPLKMDFIIHAGDEKLKGEDFRSESTKLIKYFLASLTTPEGEMWVNLSPYEQDRIIPEDFAHTEMGRDLLAQDYLLKQLTASMMHPENDLGAAFWARIYEKTEETYGAIDIPTDTYSKVWIVPETASVYVSGQSVFVVESRLKVMLDEDYVAMEKHAAISNERSGAKGQGSFDNLQLEVLREVIIPEIAKEVNEGESFAPLRQIYNSLILAAWYKKNLKTSFLTQAYVDQNKTEGIALESTDFKEEIYAQYVQALKKGVYDFIKEDYDPATQTIIPRKYFSGGVSAKVEGIVNESSSPAAIASLRADLADSAMVNVELAQPEAAQTGYDRRSALRVIGGTVASLLVPGRGARGAEGTPLRRNPQLEADLKRFFEQEWSEYIAALYNNSLDISSARFRLGQRARQINPELAAMMQALANTAILGTEAGRNSLMEAWNRFNETFLLSHRLFGRLTIIYNRKENRHYYHPVIYSVERIDLKEAGGRSVKVVYGRKVDKVNTLASMGVSIKGSPVIFIDANDVDEKVEKIQNTSVHRNPYILVGDREVSSHYVSNWVLSHNRGKTKAAIREDEEKQLRAHELTHKAQEFSGIRYALDDRFGVLENTWEDFGEEDQRSIESEVVAYLGQMIASDNPVAVLVHLMPHLLAGRMTEERFAARYIFNRLGDVSKEDWVDFSRPTSLNRLFNRLSRNPQLKEKARALYRRGFPGLEIVDPAMGAVEVDYTGDLLDAAADAAAVPSDAEREALDQRIDLFNEATGIEVDEMWSNTRLREVYREISAILAEDEDEPEEEIHLRTDRVNRMIALFDGTLLTTGNHEDIQSIIDLLRTKLQTEVVASVSSSEIAFIRRAVMSTGDFFILGIYRAAARERDVILSVDDQTLDLRRLEAPDELEGEAEEVEFATETGQRYYFSTEQQKFYPIIYTTLNMDADFPPADAAAFAKGLDRRDLLLSALASLGLLVCGGGGCATQNGLLTEDIQKFVSPIIPVRTPHGLIYTKGHVHLHDIHITRTLEIISNPSAVQNNPDDVLSYLNDVLSTNRAIRRGYLNTIKEIRALIAESKGELKGIGIESIQDVLDGIDRESMEAVHQSYVDLFRRLGAWSPERKADQLALLLFGPVLYLYLKGDLDEAGIDVVALEDSRLLRESLHVVYEQQAALERFIVDAQRFGYQAGDIRRFLDGVSFYLDVENPELTDGEIDVLLEFFKEQELHPQARGVLQQLQEILKNAEQRNYYVARNAYRYQEEKGDILIVIGGVHRQLIENILRSHGSSDAIDKTIKRVLGDGDAALATSEEVARTGSPSSGEAVDLLSADPAEGADAEKLEVVQRALEKAQPLVFSSEEDLAGVLRMYSKEPFSADFAERRKTTRLAFRSGMTHQGFVLSDAMDPPVVYNEEGFHLSEMDTSGMLSVYRGMRIAPETLKDFLENGIPPTLARHRMQESDVTVFPNKAIAFALMPLTSDRRVVPSTNFLVVVFQVAKGGNVDEYLAHGTVPPEAIEAAWVYDKTKDIFVNILSLVNEDSDILTRFLGAEYTPDRLLSKLSEASYVRDLYRGNKGGKNIGEHTKRVLRQFEKYFSNVALPAGIDRDFVRLVLALHDIGDSIINGRSTHENTKAIITRLYAEGKLPFNEVQLKIALALLDGDPIGLFIKEELRGVQDAVTLVTRGASNAGISTQDFFRLLTIYYQVDAGSYTKDAENFEALDYLFVRDDVRDRFKFDESKGRLAFSTDTEQMFLELQAAIDGAMLGSAHGTKGGIDLNPQAIELESQGGTIEFKVPVAPPGLDPQSIRGLLPVIINISPITNIPLLLGEVSDPVAPYNSAESDRDLDPVNREQLSSL